MVCCTRENGNERAYVQELLDQLTGRLIGLARATEGNDHLISTATSDLVLEGLSASLINNNLQNEYLADLIRRIEKEKYKMVPDCFSCAAPCGRTADYDMNKLHSADEDIRRMKEKILVEIQGIASFAHRAAVRGVRDESIQNFLYMALFSIGMDDWGKEELLPIIREADSMRSRAMALPDKA